MSKRHTKYAKRLTRFYELARKRSIHWTVKHIDREVPNARRVYRVLMGRDVGRKMATVGLVGAFMVMDQSWPSDEVRGFDASFAHPEYIP